MLRGFPLGNSILPQTKLKVKEVFIIAKTKREIQRYYEKRTGYAAQTKYAAANYENITLRVKKGAREKIKARAEGLGKSLNGYICDLIKNDMND